MLEVIIKTIAVIMVIIVCILVGLGAGKIIHSIYSTYYSEEIIEARIKTKINDIQLLPMRARRCNDIDLMGFTYYKLLKIF